LLPVVVRSEYLLNTAVLAGIYVILASSLNITNGYTGLFSFGHAAFYGIGAYTAAILATKLGVGFWLTLPLAGIVAAVFGAALALPTLRLSGIFLALVTIGFQEITFPRHPELDRPHARAHGHSRRAAAVLLRLRAARQYRLLLSDPVLDVFTLFVLSRIVTSRLGRAFVSIREDELAAQASGLPTFRLKVLSFVIATFFAGLAGAVFAHHARFVSADSFRLDETFLILTMLIVGGMGSFLGPIIGAIALVILPEASRFLAEYRGVVYGLVLIGVILFRPEGVAGVPGIIQPRGLLAFKAGDTEPGAMSLLEARSVSVTFGGVAALKQVSFALGENEIVGLIGPNGAGKTTLFNCLSGLQVPDEGSMLFGGMPLEARAPHQIAALGVARTFQTSRVFKRMTVLEHVLIGRYRHQRRRAVGRRRPARWVADEEEAAAHGASPRWASSRTACSRASTTFADSLSYANRRRLEIARALVSEPRLLLLDEPTAGMNPHETAGIVTLIQAIRRLGITVFLIEHDMKVIMNASDRIIVLDHGEKIAEGRPERSAPTKT
jgi:branched-chain amino acid transport system permease protein